MFRNQIKLFGIVIALIIIIIKIDNANAEILTQARYNEDSNGNQTIYDNGVIRSNTVLGAVEVFFASLYPNDPSCGTTTQFPNSIPSTTYDDFDLTNANYVYSTRTTECYEGSILREIYINHFMDINGCTNTDGKWDTITKSCIEVNCTDGDLHQEGFFTAAINQLPPIAACSNGCEVIFTGNGPFEGEVNGTPVDYYLGQYNATGETCTSGQVSPDSIARCDLFPDAQQCGNVGDDTGSLVGNDNGSKEGLSGGQTSGGTGTGASGGGSLPGNNGDTSTSTPVAGGNTGEGIPTNTGTGNDDFCTVNPTSPVCLQSNYSDSGCGTVPSCSGDAIQCAIASELHRIRCINSDTEIPPVNAAEIQAALGQTKTLEEIGQGTEIDASDPLNGYVANVTASCPADLVANTSLGPVTIPFNLFCDLADFLRPLVLLIAYFHAAMIYFNGLIREL